MFNLDLYTKSHCYCDDKFYNCLKNLDNTKASAVGDLFFNKFSIKCIEESGVEFFEFETKERF